MWCSELSLVLHLLSKYNVGMYSEIYTLVSPQSFDQKRTLKRPYQRIFLRIRIFLDARAGGG